MLGAPVPAMLLATWWVRPPSMTVGVGNPTTEVKEHFHLSHAVSHSFFGHRFATHVRPASRMLCVHQRLADEFIFGKNMIT